MVLGEVPLTIWIAFEHSNGAISQSAYDLAHDVPTTLADINIMNVFLKAFT
jgi:hypothetical protein